MDKKLKNKNFASHKVTAYPLILRTVQNISYNNSTIPCGGGITEMR